MHSNAGRGPKALWRAVRRVLSKINGFCKKKDVVFSARRYGIDALGAMAQGLFCSLLIGTILNTAGEQLGISFLVDIGAFASAMSGAAMAIAIGYALKAPPLVLFSLAAVGYASNQAGGAGGAAGCFDHCHSGGGGRQAGQQRDQGGLAGDALGDDPTGLCPGNVVGASYWRGGQRSGQPHQLGHGAAALLDGYSGFGVGWHRPDAAHLQCRHLSCPDPHGIGRRSRG